MIVRDGYTGTPVSGGGYFRAAFQNTFAAKGETISTNIPVVIGAVIRSIDFGIIHIKVMDIDAVLHCGIVLRDYAGASLDAEFAKVRTEAALTRTVLVVIVNIQFRMVANGDIYRISGDAAVVAVGGFQCGTARNYNVSVNGSIIAIFAIHIDAAASIFTSRTRIHKPADGEVRIILNVQVTAVVDAQTAAARGVRRKVRNIHVFAVVQNQCAGAKEYRRDIGSIAGVRSRIDSQLAAVLDGHFAVGRIDARILQR